MNHVLDGSTYERQLANTTEHSMFIGDAGSLYHYSEAACFRMYEEAKVTTKGPFTPHSAAPYGTASGVKAATHGAVPRTILCKRTITPAMKGASNDRGFFSSRTPPLRAETVVRSVRPTIVARWPPPPPPSPDVCKLIHTSSITIRNYAPRGVGQFYRRAVRAISRRRRDIVRCYARIIALYLVSLLLSIDVIDVAPLRYAIQTLLVSSLGRIHSFLSARRRLNEIAGLDSDGRSWTMLEYVCRRRRRPQRELS